MLVLVLRLGNLVAGRPSGSRPVLGVGVRVRVKVRVRVRVRG